MPLPIEKIKSLRLWEQIPSLFIVPFPSLHDIKAKPQLELCALLQFAFRIANQ
jgi:hypothetical protein